MDNGENAHNDCEATLNRYLQSWGLQEFHDEQTYYEWQRKSLSAQDLRNLQWLVEQRQGGKNTQADIQFYDLLADPSFLPILYSQRFDYFRQLGKLLASRLSSFRQVLDFGCGVGILTCFLAQQNSESKFVGLDRSPHSINIAKEEAEKRKISNVRFAVLQDMQIPIDQPYDGILSTQAIFQAEQEPGLPSQNWKTFERQVDESRQRELEIRTGLNERLEALLNALSPDGRLICFEKTWNLGRRVFFQRALSARNLFPICEPMPCSYHELGEPRVDGPLYEVSRMTASQSFTWDESPFYGEGESVYRCGGHMAERMGKELLKSSRQEKKLGKHENHGNWSIRCGVWEDALSWGFLETGSGFRGLVMASKRERLLIFQLLETVGSLSSAEFERFLSHGWNTVDNVTQNTSSPGYENHFPSAEEIYKHLPRKTIKQESTFSEGQGKEMHIELGITNTLRYLYWANTFDQRQLLLVDEQGEEILEEYFQESVEAAQGPS